MSRQISVIAHDIRSLWNIGSLFRTCDAFDVSELILSGYSAVPPRREISKTALGADEWIAWRKTEDIESEIQSLKECGFSIVGLEICPDAEEVIDFKPDDKTVLLLGHEVTGIPAEHLRLCDRKMYIPMLGKKESLNVSVATGIALHQLRNG